MQLKVLLMCGLVAGGALSAQGAEPQLITENKLCQAIQSGSVVHAVVKNREVINTKEIRFTTSLLTIEPYAIGTTGNGSTRLLGDVTDSKVLREVTLKVFENRFRRLKNGQGGMFTSNIGVNEIDLRDLEYVEIIPGSHFEAPQNIKGFEEEWVEERCSLSL